MESRWKLAALASVKPAVPRDTEQSLSARMGGAMVLVVKGDR